MQRAGPPVLSAREGRVSRLNNRRASSVDGGARCGVVELATARRRLVEIEIDHLRLVQLPVADIDRVGVKNLRLVGMRGDAVLVVLAVVIVRRRQMGMSRRQRDREEGGQQKKLQRGVDSSLDHAGIELNGISGFRR